MAPLPSRRQDGQPGGSEVVERRDRESPRRGALPTRPLGRARRSHGWCRGRRRRGSAALLVATVRGPDRRFEDQAQVCDRDRVGGEPANGPLGEHRFAERHGQPAHVHRLFSCHGRSLSPTLKRQGAQPTAPDRLADASSRSDVDPANLNIVDWRYRAVLSPSPPMRHTGAMTVPSEIPMTVPIIAVHAPSLTEVQ